jgi:hypothetical protein
VNGGGRRRLPSTTVGGVLVQALDPVELLVIGAAEAVGDLLGLGPGRVAADAVAIAVVVPAYDDSSRPS